ncbi:MAG: nucleotidyltransferase domain-containing protein [Candidatus Hodarchaeales archaeon]
MTSLDMLKQKLINYPHLDELDDFLQKIIDEKPSLILLFGSLARNDYTSRSDIDVLCVFDRNFSNLKERFLTSYQYSSGIVQTKTLSLEELENGLKNGNSFLHSIFKYGFVLYSSIDLKKVRDWMNEGATKIVTYPI